MIGSIFRRFGKKELPSSFRWHKSVTTTTTTTTSAVVLAGYFRPLVGGGVRGGGAGAGQCRMSLYLRLSAYHVRCIDTIHP